MDKQPYKKKYPNLFQPLEVGVNKVGFKNRIFSAPISVNLFADNNLNLRYEGIDTFASFARGGAALVTIGEGELDKLNSSAHNSHIGLVDDLVLQNLHLYNDYAHAYGAKTSIELNHNGHFAIPRFCGGMEPMSASEITMPSGIHVRQMNEDDMEQVAESYASAVFMAKRAGFDMVLLHYGHGWLMSSFLSNLLNKRTDKYGGSLENRMRFPRYILERIRQKVGDDILLELRMSGDEFTDGGITINETIEYIKMVEDLVDLVHISCGTRFNAMSRADMHPSHFVAHGHNAPNSALVKKAGVKIPVGVVGKIYNPMLAESILENEQADYILMARSWIADPDWAEKVRHGHEEDIRPCLRCNFCLDAGDRVAVSKYVLENDAATKDMYCAVNPLFGNSCYKKNAPMPQKQRKVVVIGGGVAGMEAALDCVKRGHDVVLYEKNDKLGGQLFYADYVWFKQEMKDYREYLISQINKSTVTVKLNSYATPESIEMEMADAVIVAVGAEPLIPSINGVELSNVTVALNVFGKEDTLKGEDILIVGGGLIGCETSIHLGSKGKRVTVIEMGEYLAPDAQLSERLHTLQYMERAGVVSYTNTKCIEITDSGAWVVDSDQEKRFIKASHIVLACGMKPLIDSRDSFSGSAFDVINIGDCEVVSGIKHAVHSAFNASLRIM